jgi:capsular polysaccharide transport system permease protein
LLARAGFAMTVLLPTFAAAFYFGLWATPRYVSEAKFVVRGANSQRVTGLQAMFRSFGFARAVDDAHIVQQYMLSRDAVMALEKAIPLREIFARPEADALSRYPRFWEDLSFEKLYDHYLWRVSVRQDVSRGITTLRAESTRAEDAHLIAEKLLSQAENIVNRMNERGLNDAARLAQGELAQAEAKLVEAQEALTRFRNESILVDPNRTSVAALETISALSKELTGVQTNIVEAQRNAPSSPAVAVARARADALSARIAVERGQLAGDDKALAAKVSAYERLTLTRDLADKRVTAATMSLENARAEARRQQIYIERIVSPMVADLPTEPRALRAVFSVVLVCFLAYAVAWILMIGAVEHGAQRLGAAAEGRR